MSDITRRHFIKTCSVVAAGFSGLHLFSCSLAEGTAIGDLRDPGYGKLISDPQGILDLPADFSYRVISRMGEQMSDGFVVPGLPDGMATFPGPDGTTIIIRNHELTPVSAGPFGREQQLLGKINPAKVYDFGRGKTPSCGGTTTMIYDTSRQTLVDQHLSLAGTMRNCAGGPTPWQTWISCEESVQKAEDNPELDLYFEKNHGYNFEVPAVMDGGLVDPVPLKAMGRFNHEAVAVDAATGIVYQTEDRDDGLIYRYIPDVAEQLVAGGRLQALVIDQKPSMDTRNWNRHAPKIRPGQVFDISWIDIDDPDVEDDDLRYRGFKAGAARFARAEGMWYGGDSIYFACTSGGKKKLGQIWRLIPDPRDIERGQLQLFVEPNAAALVKNADNLTVAPWGDLVVCEDRQGKEVRLIGVTPQGKLYTLARHHKRTEFAGATFSPDGSTLFVNIQGIGWTLAITGPWERTG